MKIIIDRDLNHDGTIIDDAHYVEVELDGGERFSLSQDTQDPRLLRLTSPRELLAILPRAANVVHVGELILPRAANVVHVGELRRSCNVVHVGELRRS